MRQSVPPCTGQREVAPGPALRPAEGQEHHHDGHPLQRGADGLSPKASAASSATARPATTDATTKRGVDVRGAVGWSTSPGCLRRAEGARRTQDGAVPRLPSPPTGRPAVLDWVRTHLGHLTVEGPR